MRQVIADGKVDGRYIAVGGYWSELSPSCPYVPHLSPLTGFCTGITFADTREVTEMVIGDPSVVVVPETANRDLLWQSFSYPTPGAVVVIGHSGDARAAQCVEDCAHTFVIDNAAWVNGSLAPDPNTGPFASAVMPGEQLIAGVQTEGSLMNDLDPRFLGWLAGTVRYVRVASSPPDADGLRDGSVRLLSSDPTARAVELPLRVAADYDPARVILDLGERSYYDKNRTPMVTVSAGGNVLLESALGYAVTPLVLEPGDYLLHAWSNNAAAKPVDGVECDLQIAPSAAAHLAFAAKFSRSGCTWAPENSTF